MGNAPLTAKRKRLLAQARHAKRQLIRTVHATYANLSDKSDTELYALQEVQLCVAARPTRSATRDPPPPPPI